MLSEKSFSGAPAAEGRHAELITIEPMHSFWYGHLHQRRIARGRLRTYDDGVAEDAPILLNMHCLHLYNLILEIHFMFN